LSTRFQYEAFGLRIESELLLPELGTSDFSEPDLEIVFGSNPVALPDPKDTGVVFQASGNEFLFRLETVGSFYVTEGKRISVERLNNSTDDEIRLFLLGSAMGALLHQRGALPLHGSTVVKNDRALIVSGRSGAGKSSLAAKLLDRGYRLLADDISVIRWVEGNPVVIPGIPHLKLWEDVLLHLDNNPEDFLKVRPQLLKYKKPAGQAFSQEPATPGVIIILAAKNSEGIEIRELKGQDKFSVLKNNTYRIQYVQGLGHLDTHFRLISRLAENVRIFEVKRPVSPISLNELADKVDELLN